MKKYLFSLLFAAAILNAAPVCIGAQTLYPVVVNGRWGFTDKSGETVINPQFDQAEVFAEGLAPVKMGRWGYVDASGKIVINPQFDKADVFSEGLAAVKLGGGPGPAIPDDPRPFSPLAAAAVALATSIRTANTSSIRSLKMPECFPADSRRSRWAIGASLTRPGKSSSTRNLTGRSRFPKGSRPSSRANNGGLLTRAEN